MASTPSAAEPFAVAVFAKAPVPGAVKTRLVPMLGEAGAAHLQEWLLRRALEVATRSGAQAVSLWCAPDSSHPFFAACAREFGVPLREQSGGGLGERMRNAFDALLGDLPVLLMGSDCPSMSEADLRRAAASLVTHDVVLQPAEDGGYVLVGMRRPLPAMFEEIEWGSATVMRDTRRRLRAVGATWREMPIRWDVDRPADVTRLQTLGWYPGEPKASE